MNRVNLEDYLRKNGHVQSGMIAKSNLIEKLEIYGFVNSCYDEKMYLNYLLFGYMASSPNGFVNKDSSRQIVLSNTLYQVTSHYSKGDCELKGLSIPIYDFACISKNEGMYGIEDLYVPSLLGNRLYKDIKRHIGHDFIVNEYKISKAECPSNIIAIDGKAFLKAPASHIQLLDKDGVVKSVGENIMAVCRYLHDVSGAMCYTQYNLNEVFVDDEN